MSRALKKAVEAAKHHRKDGVEVNVPDEGIVNLDDVPELFSLNNLTRLVLSHNKISILPPEIGELRSLEYLNLFNNHLEDLPTTISALPRLRELNIALNRLCELPRGFGSFPALEILDLTYNNLTNSSFSANFSYLGECLRCLYMGDNDLTEFPPQIEKFVHLEIEWESCRTSMAGHVDSWCKKTCDPHLFTDLNEVDTEVCEQVFSWLSRYGKMTQKMGRHTYIFFLLYICELHNNREIEKLKRANFL